MAKYSAHCINWPKFNYFWSSNRPVRELRAALRNAAGLQLKFNSIPHSSNCSNPIFIFREFSTGMENIFHTSLNSNQFRIR